MKKVWLFMVLAAVTGSSLQAALVNHWPLNEGSGLTVSDTGAGGNTGVFQEGTAVAGDGEGPGWVTDPARGSVLSFDGTTDYILTDSDGVLGATPRTVACWFNLAVDQYRHTLVEWGDGGIAGGYFRVVIEDGRLRLEVSSGYTLAMNAGDIPAGTWHQVTLVVDDFNNDGKVATFDARFYLDGVFTPRAGYLGRALSTTQSGDDWVRLGGGSGNATVVAPREPLNGLLSDVRIYDNSMTDGEVYQLYLESMGTVATAPAPGNGAIDVPVETDLSWTAPTMYVPEAGYSLILRKPLKPEDPNFVLAETVLEVSNATATAPVPVSLDYDSTYFWRVDSYEPAGAQGDASDDILHEGAVWSFTTMPSIPVITVQPANMLTDEGGSAQTTVEYTSVTASSVQWYKSADNVNNTPDDDSAAGTGATLTLAAATTADEGYYYAVVSNESNVDVYSTPAKLEIRKLVAWYPFDDSTQLLSITDMAGDFDGVAVSELDPNNPAIAYEPTANGNAVSFTAANQTCIEVPRMVENSFSFEIWVKTTATGGTGEGWWAGQGIIDGEMPGYVDDFGSSLLGSKFAFGARGNNSIASTSDINDGQWHHCVGTRDQLTGEICVYVDGAREAVLVAAITNTLDDPAVLQIGDILNGTGDRYFDGQIDDIKVYNYPLAELSVAKNFNDVTGESVCITSMKPDSAYDFNGDCVIGLADLSVLAANWLDCAIYPDCL